MLRLQLSDLSSYISRLLRKLGLSGNLAQAITQAQPKQPRERFFPEDEDPTSLPPVLLRALGHLQLIRETIARTPPAQLRYAELEQGLEIGHRVVEGLELQLARHALFPAEGFTTEIAQAQMKCAHSQAERACCAAQSLLDQIFTEPSPQEDPAQVAALKQQATQSAAGQRRPAMPFPRLGLPEVLTRPVTLPASLTRLWQVPEGERSAGTTERLPGSSDPGHRA